MINTNAFLQENCFPWKGVGEIKFWVTSSRSRTEALSDGIEHFVSEKMTGNLTSHAISNYAKVNMKFRFLSPKWYQTQNVLNISHAKDVQGIANILSMWDNIWHRSLMYWAHQMVLKGSLRKSHTGGKYALHSYASIIWWYIHLELLHWTDTVWKCKVNKTKGYLIHSRFSIIWSDGREN